MFSEPHGGNLVSIKDPEGSELDVKGLFRIEVDSEAASTISNIKDGIFSPLHGFVGQNDYLSILESQRLENGIPWSIPYLLHVEDKTNEIIREGDNVILNFQGKSVGCVKAEEIFRIDWRMYSRAVFGTDSLEHPGVAKIAVKPRKIISGKLLWSISPELPFSELVMTPNATRKIFKQKSWKTISAFQTRNIPHRGHEYIQKMALQSTDGLFINPVIGKKKNGDYSDEAIIKGYRTLIDNYFPNGSVLLSPINYEMMYAGPREAVIHAIMRKNFGCTHFIIGRDHAGVGSYYGPYDAQKNIDSFPDLGIEILHFSETFFCKSCNELATDRTCPHPESVRLRFSGTKIREMITHNNDPPSEFMRKEVFQTMTGIKGLFVNGQ